MADRYQTLANSPPGRIVTKRLGLPAPVELRPPRARRAAATRPRPQAVWKIPGDVGRRYADVSGDRNPIHLHPLSARLFGMPGMIAHGMGRSASR